MMRCLKEKSSLKSTIHPTFEDNLSNIAADNIKKMFFFCISNINALDSTLYTLNTVASSYKCLDSDVQYTNVFIYTDITIYLIIFNAFYENLFDQNNSFEFMFCYFFVVFVAKVCVCVLRLKICVYICLQHNNLQRAIIYDFRLVNVTVQQLNRTKNKMRRPNNTAKKSLCQIRCHSQKKRRKIQ